MARDRGHIVNPVSGSILLAKNIDLCRATELVRFRSARAFWTMPASSRRTKSCQCLDNRSPRMRCWRQKICTAVAFCSQSTGRKQFSPCWTAWKKAYRCGKLSPAWGPVPASGKFCARWRICVTRVWQGPTAGGWQPGGDECDPSKRRSYLAFKGSYWGSYCVA